MAKNNAKVSESTETEKVYEQKVYNTLEEAIIKTMETHEGRLKITFGAKDRVKDGIEDKIKNINIIITNIEEVIDDEYENLWYFDLVNCNQQEITENFIYPVPAYFRAPSALNTRLINLSTDFPEKNIKRMLFPDSYALVKYNGWGEHKGKDTKKFYVEVLKIINK